MVPNKQAAAKCGQWPAEKMGARSNSDTKKYIQGLVG